MAQNKLSNILRWHPSVKISMPAIDADAQQWTFKHNGEFVQYTDSGHYSFGTYGMYSFDLVESTDGVRRPCVGSVNRDPMREEELEKMIQKYLTDYERVKFLREENDLIWIQLIHPYGFHANAAIDKGTLLLRKMQGICRYGLSRRYGNHMTRPFRISLIVQKPFSSLTTGSIIRMRLNTTITPSIPTRGTSAPISIPVTGLIIHSF